MALQGETISTGASNVCPDCNIELEEMVLQSAAGYYIGTQCDCGPYSRESGYYLHRHQALEDWANDTWERRDTSFNPSGLTFEILDTEEA